jgi:hypothetical protein
MIFIKPTGGLCNYLRVIFSYYAKAIQQKEILVVIWNKTNNCPGFFLDYFKPIENVLFVKDNYKKYEINYKGCSIDKNFIPNYSKLELLEEIKYIILAKRELLGEYIALHIRRTDHIVLAKTNNKYTDDDVFYNFINNKKGNKNLYIATDNKLTFDVFFKKYSDFMKIPYHDIVKGKRETSLQDAIIDLYMCVYADEFLGSGWSSFSDLIYKLRSEIQMIPPTQRETMYDKSL